MSTRPTDNAEVKLVNITRTSYDALTTKDANTLYYVQDDTNNSTRIYLGDREYPFDPVPTKTCVLYEDGTLIINELSTDRARNIAIHGPVYKEYDPISDAV